MASMFLTNGTRVTKDTFPTTAIPAADLPKVVSANIFDTRRTGLSDEVPQGSLKRVLYRAGDVLTQRQIDVLFPAAIITTVTPATGPAAGGTTVKITGQNLDGVTSVTFGGVAGTVLVVVDDRTLTVKTAAVAAGAKDIVVVDDSGNTTRAGGFTFA